MPILKNRPTLRPATKSDIESAFAKAVATQQPSLPVVELETLTLMEFIFEARLGPPVRYTEAGVAHWNCPWCGTEEGLRTLVYEADYPTKFNCSGCNRCGNEKGALSDLTGCRGDELDLEFNELARTWKDYCDRKC